MRPVLHAPGSLSPKDAISTDRSYAAVARRGARPISSSSGNRGRQGSPYRPVGKAKLITRPIATPPRLYRSARGEIARVTANWGLGAAPLEVTSPVISSCLGSRIVFYAKFPTLTLSSCPGKDIVLARKRCRPAQEQTSSYPGTHIVLSGNLYRLTGEKLSFRLGNTRSFPLQTCPFSSA